MEWEDREEHYSHQALLTWKEGPSGGLKKGRAWAAHILFMPCLAGVSGWRATWGLKSNSVLLAKPLAPDQSWVRPNERLICEGAPFLNLSQGIGVFQEPAQGPGLLHYRLRNPIKGGNRGEPSRRMGAGLFKIQSSFDLELLRSQETVLWEVGLLPSILFTAVNGPIWKQIVERSWGTLFPCAIMFTFHVH